MVLARRVSSLFVTAPVLCFVGLSFFFALLYKQYDLVVLCLLVFAVIGGLRLWGHMSLMGVRFIPVVNKERVFAGDDLACEARAENSKLLPVWLEIKASCDGLTPLSQSDDMTLSAESGVLWNQEAYFRWNLSAMRRGIHRIGPFQVMSGDLFGFFPRDSGLGGTLHVIVYPRLVPLGTLSLTRRDFFGVAGGDSPVKDPVYILGTTDYHHGKPAKYIHWKASARHHRLQEKVFEASQQEKILLVVDVDRFIENEAVGPFESTLEVVASLTVELDRKGCAVGLLTNGVITGGGISFLGLTRNSVHLPRILETLARIKMESTGTLAGLVERGLSLPWGVSCLYFTYDESDGAGITAGKLRRLRVPVTMFTYEKVTALRKSEYEAPDIRADLDGVSDLEIRAAS